MEPIIYEKIEDYDDEKSCSQVSENVDSNTLEKQDVYQGLRDGVFMEGGEDEEGMYGVDDALESHNNISHGKFRKLMDFDMEGCEDTLQNRTYVMGENMMDK
ncbi:hypothetical protein L1987_20710 [Smallanthus sonchifolius]|uniref:Uncharacterized protein n=1 Tax=Smallanthus sonchifolius TaxID=185202 RepID=A0ACB9IT43_9ASTR|nr:hypothetical protein L1987_20710 [Smallanthus sonchifolius]